MRRFLSCFRYTETPMGNELPPMIGLRLVLLIAISPVVVYFAERLHQPMALVVYLVAFILLVLEHAQVWLAFKDGMRLGRDELTDETFHAWVSLKMDPGDYLLRETWFGEGGESAARQVRRPAKRRTHPSRHSS